MPVTAWLRAAALVLFAVGSAPAMAQSSASPFTSAVRYDANGRVVGSIAPDPDGTGPLHFQAVRNTYDGKGRLTKVEKGELSGWQSEAVLPASWSGFTVFQTQDIEYDVAWRKVKESLSSGGTTYAVTQYSYDAANRLECVAMRMNPAVFGSLPTSACTLYTTGSNGPDRITKTVYDAAGQIVQTFQGWDTSLSQAYATYGYSQNGKRTAVIDAGGNKATMTYDGHDRQVAWNFPSKTTPGSVSSIDFEAYAYDAAGNRTGFTKRNGRTLTYSYDALNRVTTKIVPDGSGLSASQTRDVYYGYDLRGLLAYARFDSTSGEGITNTFDGFGRLSATASTMGGTSRSLSYGYNHNGDRVRMTWPDGQYVYDMRDDGGRVAASYLNEVTALVHPVFDAQGRVTSLDRYASGSWGASTSYGYDAISRLSTQTDAPSGGSVTTTFSYNPDSQIVTRARSNDAYVWDGYASLNRSYAANGLNQYTAVGSTTPTYDANGNLTSDGTTYLYDVENRLVSASSGAVLSYDPLGRLDTITKSGATTRLYTMAISSPPNTMDRATCSAAMFTATASMIRSYGTRDQEPAPRAISTLIIRDR